jgi:hypothetical protein
MISHTESVVGAENEVEIERVRDARHRISAKFGHDPYRLVAHYMERQKDHPERVVSAPGKVRQDPQ